MPDLIFGGGKPRSGDSDAPKIEFPCRYPVKVLGAAHPEFKQSVTSVMQRHAPELLEEDISIKASREARFVSITFNIVATGAEQLQAIYSDLKAVEGVKMVI